MYGNKIVLTYVNLLFKLFYNQEVPDPLTGIKIQTCNFSVRCSNHGTTLAEIISMGMYLSHMYLSHIPFL